MTRLVGHLSILDDPQGHYIVLRSSHDLVDHSEMDFLSTVFAYNKITILG